MHELAGENLSPKAMAAALGVSESSIKRWADAGWIKVHRTAGGHRRILRSDAIRFARERRLQIVRADLLGIRGDNTLTRAQETNAAQLAHLLKTGEIDEARKVIHGAYLSGTPLATLFDGPIVDAMAQIGEEWLSGKEGIFIEHRATIGITAIIAQLTALQPEVSVEKPAALGGSPPNDPHTIPSQMVASIFREHQWRTCNLGSRTPLYSFLDAAEAERPEVVWLALKTELNDGQCSGIVALCERLIAEDVLPILGGSAAAARRNQWPVGTRLVDSMTELGTTVAAMTP